VLIQPKKVFFVSSTNCFLFFVIFILLLQFRPYREGFIKNRYIARTFIMPGQALRQKKIRLKLSTVKSEFKDKVVLLVDDSIVRGSTSFELVQMARDAGAKKVYFASAAPPVRFANVYGIDIPTRNELVAFDRSEDDVARVIGADKVIYNDLEDLIDAVRSLNPTAIDSFDTSCFSGQYVTPEVSPEYIAKLESRRGLGRTGAEVSVVRSLSESSSSSTESLGDNNRDQSEDSSEKKRARMPSPCEGLHNPTPVKKISFVV
jgi:hypothetical protein